MISGRPLRWRRRRVAQTAVDVEVLAVAQGILPGREVLVDGRHEQLAQPAVGGRGAVRVPGQDPVGPVAGQFHRRVGVVAQSDGRQVRMGHVEGELGVVAGASSSPPRRRIAGWPRRGGTPAARSSSRRCRPGPARGRASRPARACRPGRGGGRHRSRGCPGRRAPPPWASGPPGCGRCGGRRTAGR